LILDNCEHMLDASAVVAATALRAGPSVRIIATTRQALSLPGERVLRIDGLSLPKAGVDLTAVNIVGYEGIALFCERAADASGFILTDTNAESVAGVCRRLDGVPLAIELASARTRAFDVGEIRRRLIERLELPADRSGVGPERHQSLRATIEWSYSLLRPAEQALLARLAVFPGTFDISAVERLSEAIDKQEAGEVLASLVEKSMVLRESTGDTSRFRLLDAIREFALETLREGPDELDARRAHARWYRDLAEELTAEAFGRHQAAVFTRLDAEIANIDAAIGFSVADAECREIGVQLVGSLWQYLAIRSLGDGRRWADTVLSLDGGDPKDRGRALLTAGVVAFYQGDLTTAMARLREADRTARAGQDFATVGRSLVYLAWSAVAGRDPGAAVSSAHSALTLLLAIDDEPGVALAREALGFAHLLRDEIDEARAELQAAEAICRAHDERWLLSYVTYSLGIAAMRTGDATAALHWARESIRLKQDIDDRVGTHRVLELFVILLAARGQHAQAATVLGATIANTRLVGTRVTAWTDDSLAYAEASIRQHLGSRFAAAFERGLAMTAQQTVDMLTDARPAAEPADRSAVASRNGLSRRELEVAELVVEGHTNKEIGARLFLSERTVESHVRNILDKLGARSRVQIATMIRGDG
jgi:non-specific serine/threonine protein kinase